MVVDGRVTIEETMMLLNWLLDNETYLPKTTFNCLTTTLNEVVHDGEISQHEEQELIRMCNRLLDPSESSHSSVACEGKTFCLTGDFDYGDKGEVGESIESRGGVILGNVTKKCDYVVLGARGSDRWSYGNYGSKVKKALELQDGGHHIQIVKETDLPWLK